jgi:5-methylcytosine-specific restriction endonuclease McrA
MKTEAAKAWAKSEKGKASAKRTRERMGSRTEYNAVWRAANRECDLERKRQWYRENRQRSRETTEAWKRAHPEAVAQHDDKKRAIRMAAPYYEAVDRTVVYQMHGGMCGVCLEFIDLTQTGFHVDHVIPLARGGVHAYINVQPAHPKCNIGKGAKLPEAVHGRDNS